MIRCKYLMCYLFLFGITAIIAQITHPKISPRSVIRQEAGLTTLIVDYSRPSARGREIFGKLVPYERIWRVGANESTKFTTTETITVMGNTLAAGTYALYAFPGKKSWEIVFHSNTSHWGDGRADYNANEDVFRIRVQPIETKDFQENFVISFDEISHNSLVMHWDWANTRIRIPIALHTHSLMMKQIKKELAINPSAASYYQAARYLQEQNINSKQALQWLKKAETLEGPKYYISRVRSLLYASQEHYKKAIEAAKNSLQMAKALGKDEFVRINEENIKNWSVKPVN
jgi:hypothetical protein